MKTINVFFISIFALALVSCGGGKKEQSSGNAQLEGTITIDGSSTVYPITEAVAEEFKKIQPNVRVSIGVSGTGGGFKKFGRNEIDINNASRTIKAKEIAACDSSKIEYIGLTIAYDGLAVIANPQNTWLESITVEELKKIWEPAAQGKIMKWNQIRPEWPNKEIHLFGPGVASGTYDYFTEAIVGESGSSRGDFTASEDDHVLVQGVASDMYGLGFFGLAYYEENMNKLKLIGVDNGKGAVKPSLETVASKEYAPLSRPIFIYVNKNAAKREEVKSFVEFYMKNVSVLSKDVGYIPLPDSLYTKELQKFQDFIK
ncbi:MAG TPA: PstS family phosphate ABC transporter substrate-binding protein [Bacteroidales bacterium]|jgi:phosphate transport system substrate-binding protein|nr:PstS family phosphate ABC transporter substrate-binding protein [Bacteroidales bacterium]HRS18397.1 PstS family phosphate ABC transporter substrate-binding protein [Bacteroidales bacterium]